MNRQAEVRQEALPENLREEAVHSPLQAVLVPELAVRLPIAEDQEEEAALAADQVDREEAEAPEVHVVGDKKIIKLIFLKKILL